MMDCLDSEEVEGNLAQVYHVETSNVLKKRKGSLEVAFILSTKRQHCLGGSRLNDDGHRNRIEGFAEHVVPRYTDCEFLSHFRMTRYTLQVVSDHLGRVLSQRESFNPTVPIYKRTLAAIWLLATPESYRSVADRFGLSTSTLHLIVMEFVTVFSGLKTQFISWPTECEAKLTMAHFEEKYGFPGTVGAVDGCHIDIKEPVSNKVEYYNRKSRTSILLQGTCHHTMKFTDVCVGWPGSVHDARVWWNSALKRGLENGFVKLPDNGHLVGDSAYPLKLYLLTPFRDNGHLSTKEVKFNKKLSACRARIEHAYAYLKGKWRRLKYLDMSLIDKITDVITTCCVLHNIILTTTGEMGDDMDDLFEDDQELAEDPRSVNAATRKRNQIANNL